MNRATRRIVIAGNWKMNKTPAEATELINAIKAEINGKKTDECEIVACVPYVDITNAIEAAKGSPIKIGAENVHWEKSGAFTGEISADMLKAVGVEYVIIGHSERRQYFGETDETVNLRTKTALAKGLKVILCVGELLEARQAGITDEIVAMQIKLDLAGIEKKDLANIIIAYEPVWAIGTGLTATPEQADEVCGLIRATIAKLYGADAAEAMIIQYGGAARQAQRGRRSHRRRLAEDRRIHSDRHRSTVKRKACLAPLRIKPVGRGLTPAALCISTKLSLVRGNPELHNPTNAVL